MRSSNLNIPYVLLSGRTISEVGLLLLLSLGGLSGVRSWLSLGGLSGVYRVVSQIGWPYARVKPSLALKWGRNVRLATKV